MAIHDSPPITMKIHFMPYMYGSVEECIKYGNHLTTCDEDGYCNLCGYQESAEDLESEETDDE